MIKKTGLHEGINEDTETVFLLFYRLDNNTNSFTEGALVTPQTESSLNKISIDQAVAPQAKKTILTETEKDASSIRCYRLMDASANSIKPQASRNLNYPRPQILVL